MNDWDFSMSIGWHEEVPSASDGIWWFRRIRLCHYWWVHHNLGCMAGIKSWIRRSHTMPLSKISINNNQNFQRGGQQNGPGGGQPQRE